MARLGLGNVVLAAARLSLTLVLATGATAEAEMFTAALPLE